MNWFSFLFDFVPTVSDWQAWSPLEKLGYLSIVFSAFLGVVAFFLSVIKSFRNRSRTRREFSPVTPNLGIQFFQNGAIVPLRANRSRSRSSAPQYCEIAPEEFVIRRMITAKEQSLPFAIQISESSEVHEWCVMENAELTPAHGMADSAFGSGSLIVADQRLSEMTRQIKGKETKVPFIKAAYNYVIEGRLNYKDTHYYGLRVTSLIRRYDKNEINIMVAGKTFYFTFIRSTEQGPDFRSGFDRLIVRIR